MNNILLILFLFIVFAPTGKTQTYYSGKISSISNNILLQNKEQLKKRKNKIYVRQTIDSSSIVIDVIIKTGNKKIKTRREYKRFILGKHYPDFRLFVKNRVNENIRYIRPGDRKDMDIYDGILRSLIPDFEFFHEKTHATFYQNKLENLYKISFDIIKEKEEDSFKHEFQFERSLELNNFYYTATGITNSQQKIERIKIESIFWKGPSSKPFQLDKKWIELGQIRKKRKLRRMKKLFFKK